MDHFGTPSGEGPVRGPVEVALDDLVDESATFEDFFARERDRLFGLLVLVTGDRHEAEDLAQDAFVATWARWDRVGTVENPAGYLHRTAMNAFRRRYRRAPFDLFYLDAGVLTFSGFEKFVSTGEPYGGVWLDPPPGAFVLTEREVGPGASGTIVDNFTSGGVYAVVCAHPLHGIDIFRDARKPIALVGPIVVP